VHFGCRHPKSVSETKAHGLGLALLVGRGSILATAAGDLPQVILVNLNRKHQRAAAPALEELRDPLLPPCGGYDLRATLGLNVARGTAV
jgi:hypothetical protein